MIHKTWRVMGLTVWLVVLLALVAGCGAAQPEPTAGPAAAAATAESAVDEFVAAYPLAGTAWELEFFGPVDQPQAVLPDSRATVTYFWDNYAGFDGCNWFQGTYTASAEGDLRMMSPARTDLVCEPAVYDQAGLYDSSLVNVTEFSIEGEQLAAGTVNDQRLLTYNPARPVPMPGTEWGLAFWWHPGDAAWYPAIPGSGTTLTFGQDGQASGSGGCNSYSASYEGDLQVEKVMEATSTYAELPTLTFGPVAAQMAACAEPEGIMDQEQGYFVALGSTAYYFKLGGMLLMVDANGLPLLVLGAHN